MIFKVELSEQAEQDLRSIYEYIFYTLIAPQAASLQLNRLEKAIKELESFPERFKEYEQKSCYSENLRRMTVDNYCVLFSLDLEMKQVFVLRILYDASDFSYQLNKKSNTDGYLVNEK